MTTHTTGPDQLVDALAQALMDHDAEIMRGEGATFTPELRAEVLPTYRDLATRIILPRLWEAGYQTWEPS